MSFTNPTQRVENTNKWARQNAEITSERTARGAHRVTGVSRGHIKSEKRALITRGLTPMKARTVPLAEWQG